MENASAALVGTDQTGVDDVLLAFQGREKSAMRFRMLLIRVGLLPFDLLPRIVGPSYRLFHWFFLLTPPRFVAWQGRLRAIRAADVLAPSATGRHAV